MKLSLKIEQHLDSLVPSKGSLSDCLSKKNVALYVRTLEMQDESLTCKVHLEVGRLAQLLGGLDKEMKSTHFVV